MNYKSLQKYQIIIMVPVLLFCFALEMYGQSSLPVRTRWISPENSKPLGYEEWKSRWESEQRQMGGEVKFRSWQIPAVEDSFVFGQDSAYFKDYVRHSNGDLCEDLPPVSSFVVWLNHNDQKILTDQAPRWSIGDPNISGRGWFGIELANFAEPSVSVGDTFSITFTCYCSNELPEQGRYDNPVLGFPMVAWPSTLHLQALPLPLPPTRLTLVRENGSIRLGWQQESGLSYIVYRRNQADTLALNFPRYQYDKISDGIIDSFYVDSGIDTSDTYGYVIFAEDLNSGLISGRSREIRESETLMNVRAVLVQPEIYPAIQNRLMQLVSDWEAEGANVIVYAMQFPTPQALRDTLRSIQGLQGSLLIGDFPVPWFQFEEEDGTGYQEYPADLYFMDLDGYWEDNLIKSGSGAMIPGSDGIFDTHYANYPRNTEKPEIVIGRITPTPGMGGADEIINLYLRKCYDYRHDIGDIRQTFSALAFPDDDWDDWGHDIANSYISQFYQNYQCIWDINATTATAYRAQLDEHFSLIHVWVHSWSGGHAFSVNNGTQNEYFYNSQILPAGTNANFYVLFACGNSRYVEDQNCAGIYAFMTPGGINTIGSTHSGGMLHYDYLYPALARGLSFGEAFLKTFQQVGEMGFTREMKGWYYGLTFNGDPFVIPKPQAVSLISDQEQPLPEHFDLSNYPNPFNSGTRISARLPGGGQVTLNIFNILGELIYTRQDYLPVGGQYVVDWNGATSENMEMPSGIYFYQIVYQRQASTLHKMVLIK